VPNPRRWTTALLARAPLLILLAITVALALGGRVAAAAPAHPAHRADTAITGVVVNGTHSGAPVAGQPVTLQATGGNGAHDIASATTDSQGRFSFANLANADTSVFAVYTRFQQGLYSTGAITVENGIQNVTLTVYDATNSDAALRITSVTALVRDPRPKNGLIGIGEFYTFHNGGATAFVGSAAPANGQPMGLLRFALPPGASNLKLGAGFDGTQAAQAPTGFGAAATVPPGDSQFAFAFDLPYSGTERLFPLKAEYPADHILLLAPPAIRVDAPELAARGPVSSLGGQYDAYTRDALASGAELHARLWDLPSAGEPPVLDFLSLMALTIALGLLLAMLLGLYLRCGDLAIALHLAPATALAKGPGMQPVELTADEREVERVRLLRRLLTLQQASPSSRPSGRFSAAQYRQQIGQTRAALRALLASLPPDEVGGQPQAPTARTEASVADASAALDVALDVAPSDAGLSRMLSGGGR
jgi:5-hydroxyisourate hydrolase-like protein (transthyretin family)